MKKKEPTKLELASEANEAEPEQGSKKRVRMWIAVGTLATISSVGAIAVMFFGGEPDDAEVLEEQTEPVDLRATLATADSLMKSGKPKEALELYMLAEQVTKPAEPSQQFTGIGGSDVFASNSLAAYRQGLAAEQLGELDTAIEKFREISRDKNSEVANAAIFGLARVKYELEQYSEVVQMLSPLVLRSARPGFQGSKIAANLNFMLGLAVAGEVRKEKNLSVFETEHVFGPQVRFSNRELFELESFVTSASPNLSDQDSSFGVRIHGTGETPNTTLLSAGFDNQTIAEVLDLLALAANWNIVPTETANEIVLVKRADIHLVDRTAAELLSLTLEPSGLFWQYRDGTLTIDQTENFSREELSQRKISRADDLLQFALVDSPEHRLAPHALLELGNLAHHTGRVDRAKIFLQEIEDRFLDNTVLQFADFNKAKLHLSDDDPEEALETFYQVIDARKGSILEGLSYLYAGRLYLDKEESKPAKRELARSLAIANDDELRAVAALTLATAYLREADVASAVTANEVLMEARDVLKEEPFHQQNVFLSALTRFRAAPSIEERQRLGEELLSAAFQVDPAVFFGHQGYLLVGHAFRELNLPQETVKRFQQGLTAEVGDTMHNKLLFQLAKLHRRQGELEDAKRVLLELSTSPSKEWSGKALVEIADLLVRMEQFDECLHYCRWALKGQQYSQQDAALLLRTMGGVYEELGDHKNAGLCFSGFLPPGQNPTGMIE